MSGNLINGIAITLTEFKDALNDCIMNREDKKNVLSLFNQISNTDGILNQEEYNKFKTEVENQPKSGKKQRAAADYKNTLLDILKSYLQKVKNKLTNGMAKQLEDEKLGKNIQAIENDNKTKTTKVECKTANGGTKIVEFDNATNKKKTEVEKDKNGNVIKAVEYDKIGKLSKMIETNANSNTTVLYKNGKEYFRQEENKKTGISTETSINKDGSKTVNKYERGVLTESSLIEGKKESKTVYKNGVVDYTETFDGKTRIKTPYFDGKNNEQIKNEIDKIVSELSAANNNRAPKDYKVVMRALDKGVTPTQLEAHYGKEKLQAIVDSKKDLQAKWAEVNKNVSQPAVPKQENGKTSTVDLSKYSDLEVKSNDTPTDTTYVLYAQGNTARRFGKEGAKSITFDTDWVQEDKYGSKTIDEFLLNLKKDGVEMNTEIASELVKNVRRVRYTAGHCFAHVSDTLASLKGTQYQEFGRKGGAYGGIRRNSAFQAAHELAHSDLFKEIPHNIIASMDLNNLPEGAIAVFDAQYRVSPGASDYERKNHSWGHIGVCVKNGKDNTLYTIGATKPWAINDNIDKPEKQQTHIRVFIPVKPLNTTAA